MNNINVVIIGEKDWASYKMNVALFKHVGNNLKTLKTDMMVSELGNILNTENRVHAEKELEDYTVPNLLAAYIYRNPLYTEVLMQQEPPTVQTLLLGCFRTKKADGKEGYCIRSGGVFSGNLESEEDVMSAFWTSIHEFHKVWLEDEYHPNSRFHKILKQVSDAAA